MLSLFVSGTTPLAPPVRPICASGMCLDEWCEPCLWDLCCVEDAVALEDDGVESAAVCSAAAFEFMLRGAPCTTLAVASESARTTTVESFIAWRKDSQCL